jgi:hypothetical protein
MNYRQYQRSDPAPCSYYCRHENEVIDFVKIAQATFNLRLACRICQPKQPPVRECPNEYNRSKIETNYTRNIEKSQPFWDQEKKKATALLQLSPQFQPVKFTNNNNTACGNGACVINLSNINRNRHLSKANQKSRDPEPVRTAALTPRRVQIVVKKESEKPNPKVIVIPRVPPKVTVVNKVKYLGVVNTDPHEYVKKYGPTLLPLEEISNYVSDLKLSPLFFHTIPRNYQNVHTSYEKDLQSYLERSSQSRQNTFSKYSLLDEASTLNATFRTRFSSALRDLFEFIDLKNRGVIKLSEACQFVPEFDPGKYDLRTVRMLLGLSHGQDDIDFVTFEKLYRIFANN